MIEAQRGALFTYTVKAMTNFIKQVPIPSYTVSGISGEGSAETKLLTIVVTNSKEHPTEFLSAFRQAFNTKKHFAQNYYFKQLGYSFSFAGMDS